MLDVGLRLSVFLGFPWNLPAFGARFVSFRPLRGESSSSSEQPTTLEAHDADDDEGRETRCAGRVEAGGLASWMAVGRELSKIDFTGTLQSSQ